MFWFKHKTNMLEDPWVQDVFMAEHGITAYGFLNGIYEIYGKECGSTPGDWITIPVTTITRKLRISAAKVERLLSDCSTAGKLSFEIVLRDVRIKIPKMLELRDEHTRKKTQSLRSDSGLTPAKEKETEEDKRKHKQIQNTLKADASVCVVENNFLDECHQYAIRSGNPNLQNVGWVKGYLSIQWEQAQKQTPAMAKTEFKQAWFDTIDLASSKGMGSAAWLKKVFENKLATPTTLSPVSRLEQPLRLTTEARDQLLSFSKVRHKITNDIFQTDALKIDDSRPGEVFMQGCAFSVDQLEGLADA